MLAGGVAIVALLAALAWGFWPSPVLVEVAEVVQAPMSVTVEEEGQTRVKDRFVISAPVAGFLQRIQLDVGDAVDQGQTLATMEPLRPEVLRPSPHLEAPMTKRCPRQWTRRLTHTRAKASARQQFAT